MVLGLLCGALVSAFPWYGSATLLLLVWVLRSGSLAASAAGDRRRERGRKWYDGAQFLLRTPWDLLRSLPATVMLVLWSAGLAIAAALLCYAFAAGETVTLFVCGAVFAGSVWSGPGGSRVRSPVGRVVRPLSSKWKTWLAVTFVLLVLTTAIGALAEAGGTSWSPGAGPSAQRTDRRTAIVVRGRMGLVTTLYLRDHHSLARRTVDAPTSRTPRGFFVSDEL